jgi:heme-degrading monooxygenase HmoA
MILEIAMLPVRPDLMAEFEAAFAHASAIIATMPGYLGHSLQRCMEVLGRYALLVRWRTLGDHTAGFRRSNEYQQWRALLHHFYDPFPVVEHFVDVPLATATPLFDNEPCIPESKP